MYVTLATVGTYRGIFTFAAEVVVVLYTLVTSVCLWSRLRWFHSVPLMEYEGAICNEVIDDC